MKDGEEKHKISGFSWRTKKRSKKLGKHVLGQKQGLHKCFQKVFGLLLYTTQDIFAVGYLRPVAVDFFSSLSLFPRKEREENEGAFPYFPFSSASLFRPPPPASAEEKCDRGGREDVSFCRGGGKKKRGLRCQLLRGKGRRRAEMCGVESRFPRVTPKRPGGPEKKREKKGKKIKGRRIRYGNRRLLLRKKHLKMSPTCPSDTSVWYQEQNPKCQ